MGGSLCYRGGLTERIINMLTSPVWASHRPALTYADTNSRLNMCASHGFHMKRYRCHSQLRTPGITFYPGEPNPSLKAVLLEYTYTFTLLVLYNAQFGAVISI